MKTYWQLVLLTVTIAGGLFTPATIVAAESKPAADAGNQRAVCDAKCRSDHQGNAAALQACLRSCGAIEPATASGARTAQPGAAPRTQETSNLNPSNSNVDRSVGGDKPAAGDEQPAPPEDDG